MRSIERFARIADLQNWRQNLHNAQLGFVPTMGALHQGHMELVKHARAENDHVLASIFINPTQFDNPKDLEAYPISIENDIEMLINAGVDAVFLPDANEIYPQPSLTQIDVPALSSGLIGALRPGHFQGVCTIVAKLLNIVDPDQSYFGEKDYQQLAIIRQMVTDLNFRSKIIAVPTVREADGLAMSSRNRRLDADDRQAATVISRSINASRDWVSDGLRDASMLRAKISEWISAEPRAQIERIDIVDAKTLEPIQVLDQVFAILLNVSFGGIILIDQAVIDPANPNPQG